jgi:hypothetical protein
MGRMTMNIEKVLAVKNPNNTCCNCLKEKQTHKIMICELGYGSSFDGFSTRLNFCEDCLQLTDKKWWNFETLEENEYCHSYKYEKEILEFVKQMPLAGQEMFYNQFSNSHHCNMSSQDWIDHQLGILPHEKCKEYGFYSPDEIKAYQDRFPNCKHVKINIYSDGSKGSRCFMSASGDGDGKCYGVSDECYMCGSFEERNGEIIVVDTLKEFYEREERRLRNMIEYANKRLEMIENKNLTEYE